MESECIDLMCIRSISFVCVINRINSTESNAATGRNELEANLLLKCNNFDIFIFLGNWKNMDQIEIEDPPVSTRNGYFSWRKILVGISALGVGNVFLFLLLFIRSSVQIYLINISFGASRELTKIQKEIPSAFSPCLFFLLILVSP